MKFNRTTKFSGFQVKKWILLCLFLSTNFTVFSCYAQQTVGVFQNDPSAFNGYTLFNPATSTTTYLIDNCGHVVNEWDSDFRPNSSVYLLKNGNLLRSIKAPPLVQNGFAKGGVELVDWEGNLLWQFNFSNSDFAQHHDIEWLPNGNVLVLVYEQILLPEAIANGRDPNAITVDIWPERILELEPAGANGAEVVWEWRAWDHLIQDIDSTKQNYGVVSAHPELFDLNYGTYGDGDWTHFNSIDYNAELDQIVLSSRHFSEFFIIDHSTTTAEAAGTTGGNSGKGGDILYRWGNPAAYQRGVTVDRKLFSQHDVHWIDSSYVDGGSLMVFNNGVGRPGENYSSVEVLTPPIDSDGNYVLEIDEPFGPDAFSWHYEAPVPTDLYSVNVSGAQRLPNGNTLICEGNESRFLEVTYDGTMVWEYKNPVSVTGPVTQGSIVQGVSAFRATRYGLDYPAFDGVTLQQGSLIEIDPDPSPCEIHVDPNNINNVIADGESIIISPNPFNEHFEIDNLNSDTYQVTVYSLLGQKIFSQAAKTSNFVVKTDSWSAGCYLIHIVEADTERSFSYKLIK